MDHSSTRDQIIKAADDLFYQQGYEHTSFADIAGVVNISRGNFYHHFKTKDDILRAVIDMRLANTREMLEQWETETQSPAQCIRNYINILLTNWDKIKEHGCPVGSLCTELSKLQHGSQEEAHALFSLFRSWLKKQFKLLGRKKDADELAMHVLAWSQGVATLANTYHDEKFTRREVKRMCEWLKEYET